MRGLVDFGHLRQSPEGARIEPMTQRGSVRVTCLSSSLCVAVDGSGDVPTSTDPTGGRFAWNVTPSVSPLSLSTVSCPSPHLCVASDPEGNAVVSTDPTGGKRAWHAPVSIDRNGILALWCASGRLGAATFGHASRLQLIRPHGPSSGALPSRSRLASWPEWRAHR